MISRTLAVVQLVEPYKTPLRPLGVGMIIDNFWLDFPTFQATGRIFDTSSTYIK